MTRTFDLSSQEGYLSYWALLQYTVTAHSQDRPGGGKFLLPDEHTLRRCFPVDRVNEVGRGRGRGGAGRVCVLKSFVLDFVVLCGPAGIAQCGSWGALLPPCSSMHSSFSSEGIVVCTPLNSFSDIPPPPLAAPAPPAAGPGAQLEHSAHHVHSQVGRAAGCAGWERPSGHHL